MHGEHMFKKFDRFSRFPCQRAKHVLIMIVPQHENVHTTSHRRKDAERILGGDHDGYIFVRGCVPHQTFKIPSLFFPHTSIIQIFQDTQGFFLRMELLRCRDVVATFMIHIRVFLGGAWVTMHHHNLFERNFPACGSQDDVQYHGGFPSIGFGGQQHAKWVGKIQPISVVVPMFMKRFVVVFEGNDARR